MDKRKIESIKTLEFYLQRFAAYDTFIKEKPAALLAGVVVIPSYDEDSLLACVKQLFQSGTPSKAIEIIVVLNSGEAAPHGVKELHQNQYQQLLQFKKHFSNSYINVHPILVENIPGKHAGVGMARKIGMDEAVRRLLQSGAEDGILVCYDADCRCSENFIEDILLFFEENKQIKIASHGFEHALDEGEAIIQYELFLRYYKNALCFARHPQAHYTIGSSMAVKASAYALQGGMNRRKAGEDFYFFNKISLLGAAAHNKKAVVYPSSRESQRVPFGTGRAMNQWRINQMQFYPAYDFATFILLQEWWAYLLEQKQNADYETFPNTIKSFISKETWQEKTLEISRHTATSEQWIKRFFQWFDSFMVLKFCHFYRDNYSNAVPVEQAVKQLMLALKMPANQLLTAKDALLFWRNWEQSQ